MEKRIIKQQEEPIPEKRNVKGQFVKGNIPYNKPDLKHTIQNEVLMNDKFDTDLWKEIKNKDKFIPPSLSDVEKYCNERRFAIYPPDFITYYNNYSWTVKNSGGKRTPMKDWKKAIHTWERRDRVKKIPVPRTIQKIANELKKMGCTGTIFPPPSNEIKF